MPRGKSAREFALDLRKFGEVSERQALMIFRKIILDLDRRVVLDTPVDVGRARGNWFPSLNAPSNEVDPDARDPSGSAALARINAMLASVKLGDMAWLSNNLPYILPLENGHSRQAPDGMVDVNLEAVASAYGGRIVR